MNLRGQRPWKNPDRVSGGPHFVRFDLQLSNLCVMQSPRVSLWNNFAAMLACEGRAIAAGTIENGAPERRRSAFLAARFSEQNALGASAFLCSAYPRAGVRIVPPGNAWRRALLPEFADFRITPHYPAKSPLDDVLRKVVPGADDYITEKYAFEIMRLLDEWSRALKAGAAARNVLAKFLDASLQAYSLVPIQQKSLRSEYGIEVVQRRFGNTV